MGSVVALAIAASLFYGASDFLGAFTARRLSVLKTSTVVYLAATVVATFALPITIWSYSDQALWAGIIAGILATVGMVTFYAALAIGPMSLLAPLIALIQTAIPVVVAATIGQGLRPLAWVAVGIALLATTLISVSATTNSDSHNRTRVTTRGALLAVVSGLTLGLSVVALDTAPSDSGVFPAFLDLAVGLVLLLPLVAARRLRNNDNWLNGASVPAPPASSATAASELAVGPLPVGAVTWSLSVIGGVLLGVGNILLVLALHRGNLAVVAVLVSLYPLATVVLAWFVLKERLAFVQFVGVALAITAAVLLGMS